MKFFETFYRYVTKKGNKKNDLSRQERAALSNSAYYEVEDLLCFERAVRFCYASLEMMVHNRTLRQKCQNFSQVSLANEKELEQIINESSLGEMKLEKEHQPYALPADDLTVESILSLGLVVAEHRLSIYQELRQHLSLKNRILLNHLIANVSDEIKFFKREQEAASVEGILYSLN